MIYADTVGDLGYAQELGNYAEYSGAPNEGETLNYARTLIDVSPIKTCCSELAMELTVSSSLPVRYCSP